MILRILAIFTLIVFSSSQKSGKPSTDNAKQSPSLELKLNSVKFAETEHELSGSYLGEKLLYFVTDEDEDHFIWTTDPTDNYFSKGGRFNIKPTYDLSKFKGFKELNDSPIFKKNNKLLNKKLDLEGIAVCGSFYYLADERRRNILVADIEKKTLEVLPVDLSAINGLYEGGANAGFEGVAVDCQNSMLYAAKERQPHYIIAIDLKTNKVLWNQAAIDPEFKDHQPSLGFDYSDLHFFEGHLWALSRNERAVLKIDPKTKTVLAKASYKHVEDGMYDTGEIYGIAEILIIQKDKIIVGVDNNGTPLSKKSQATYRLKGKFGSLWYFDRPAGF